MRRMTPMYKRKDLSVYCWYLACSVSYRVCGGIMAEQEFGVDHSALYPSSVPVTGFLPEIW